MKKHAIALLAGLTLIFSAQAGAEELKVGFINMVKLFDQAPQAEAASARLKKEFEPRQQNLQDEGKKLDEMEKRLTRDRDIMNPNESQKMERDLVSGKRALKLKETEFKEDFSIRRSEEMAKVQDEMMKAIQKMGKDEGYDLILFEGVSYASPKVDITDRLLKALGK